MLSYMHMTVLFCTVAQYVSTVANLLLLYRQVVSDKLTITDVNITCSQLRIHMPVIHSHPLYVFFDVLPQLVVDRWHEVLSLMESLNWITKESTSGSENYIRAQFLWLASMIVWWKIIKSTNLCHLLTLRVTKWCSYDKYSWLQQTVVKFANVVLIIKQFQ